MFRLPTNYDIESDPQQIKIQMLQSNISRILSQNRKLLTLLDYSDYFDKLREHVSIVASNWQRLNILTNEINELNCEIKTNRQQLFGNINHYYDHINKNVVGVIKSLSGKISQYQQRLVEIKSKRTNKIKVELDKCRQKYISQVERMQNQYVKIIQSIEISFHSDDDSNVLKVAMEQIEEQFKLNQINCKTELGHIQNLLSYYNRGSRTKTEEIEQILAQSSLNQQQTKAESQLSTIINHNFERIGDSVRQMDIKLKGVFSEINRVKNRKRKATKHSEQSFQNNPENIVLAEIQHQYQGKKYQLLGLGRFCDNQLYKRKILKLSLGKNSQQQAQDQSIKHHQQKLLHLQQNMTRIQCKIEEYSSFYNSVNI